MRPGLVKQVPERLLDGDRLPPVGAVHEEPGGTAEIGNVGGAEEGGIHFHARLNAGEFKHLEHNRLDHVGDAAGHDEDAVGGRLLEQQAIGANDVPDIEEVAARHQVPVIQDIPSAGLDLGDLPREGRTHEAGRLPRPDVIEGTRDQQPRPAVRLQDPQHHLRRVLADGVGRLRIRCVRFGDGKKRRWNDPVYIRAADIQEESPGRQQLGRRLVEGHGVDHVPFKDRRRVVPALSHMAPARRVDNGIGLFLRHHVVHRHAIRQVELVPADARRCRRSCHGPVDGNDLVPRADEFADQVRPNKASSAGGQDFQGLEFSPLELWLERYEASFSVRNWKDENAATRRRIMA